MTARFLLVMAVLALAGCQGSDDAKTPDGATAEEQALELIQRHNIETHLEFLADDALNGRKSGEPGYDEAAYYVAEQFAAVGMQPGGSDGGWFQQVPLATYQLDMDSPRMLLHKDDATVEYEYLEDFTASADKVSTTNAVRAEVVYAGFGVHAPEYGYSDYDGIDVEGKLVALFSNAPSTLPGDVRAYYASSRVKREEAVRRGAVGFVSLRSKRSEEYRSWDEHKQRSGRKPGLTWLNEAGEAADYFAEIRASVYLSVATATELMQDSPISFADARAATEADRPASTPLGFELSIEYNSFHDTLQSPNVIGIIPGSDPELAAEYVVFSAHLDHIGISLPVEGSDDVINNGFYDNAMGTAMIIEAGRAIAAAKPRRSVLFIALTAEESGLLGSDYFVRYPTVPAGSIVANVNIDMPLFLFPLADVIGFGSEHSSLIEPMRAAAEAEGFALTPDPVPEENLFLRSDHYSFVRQGIPSSYLDPGQTSTDPSIDGDAIVTAFRKAHYHKPSDDLSRTVEWESALRFARANARIGFLVANADERPTWNDGNFFGDKFGAKLGDTSRSEATPSTR